MTTSDNFSRRQIVGGVGLGLAAVADAVAPASAQAAVTTPTAAPMQDPVSKYPNPPFKRQTQPWPGLAGQMDPARTMVRRATRARGASPAARR